MAVIVRDVLAALGGLLVGVASGVIGIVGAATHHRQGHLLWRPALLMGVAGVAGAVLGALVAISLPQEVLARLFGAFLLFSAWRIWPRAKTVDS